MDKRIRLEGSSSSKFVQLYRKHGYNKDLTIEVGTVISPSPNIKIRVGVDAIELDKDDLVIAEHLTNHSRVVTIEHVENADRDLGNRVEKDRLDTDNLVAPYTTYTHSYVKLTYEDGLKVGDQVIVIGDEDTQLYYVMDRVVST